MDRIGFPVKMDNLGRIVIPKELRELYGINKNAHLAIFQTSEGILLSNLEYKLVKKETIEKKHTD